jgi:hypothetical protein
VRAESRVSYFPGLRAASLKARTIAAAKFIATATNQMAPSSRNDGLRLSNAHAIAVV